MQNMTPELFLPCSAREGSEYYEFQFCKTEGSARKIRKSHSFWLEDSLVVSIEEEERFIRLYGHYFEKRHGLAGKRSVDWYGVNYYSREEAAAILSRIRSDLPEDCETLLLWLEKASADYNGFFFLGI